MNKVFKTLLVITAVLSVFSCANNNLKTTGSTTKLRFIDEYVIPDDLIFEETRVGGLSGIDYANGNWYVISDGIDSPRFYNASISYDLEGFKSIKINSVVKFEDVDGKLFTKGVVDPESIRYDNETIIWTSEGV